MSGFRQAIEANDHDAIFAMLADDVVFTSPVAFKPYPGKAMTAAILRAVSQVFSDFHYVREYPHGADHALMFEAKVGDVSLTGCDFLHYDAEGLIDDFMVMVRPLSAAKALAEAMGARFEDIKAEAITLMQADA
ncbi:MAG: nuclear transport factor 2 family protein [Marmoricola sp.]